MSSFPNSATPELAGVRRKKTKTQTFRKRLRQSTNGKFPSRECTGHNIPSQTRRCAGEHKGAFGARRRQRIVLLERQNRCARKCKGGLDVHLAVLADILGCQLKEGLPHAMTGIENGSRDGVFGGREPRLDRRKGGSDFFRRIRCHGERVCLQLK